MTGPVRAALADTSARVEPTSDGFLLNLGPSGGMGQGNDGVVSLVLSSGKVASARLRVEGEEVSGFCLVPTLGIGGQLAALALRRGTGRGDAERCGFPEIACVYPGRWSLAVDCDRCGVERRASDHLAARGGQRPHLGAEGSASEWHGASSAHCRWLLLGNG